MSDAWQGYSGIEPEIYDHLSVSQAAQKRAGGSPSAVPGVRLAPGGGSGGSIEVGLRRFSSLRWPGGNFASVYHSQSREPMTWRLL